MEKLNQFFEKVLDILAWARDNGHISDNAENVLISNIEDAKDEVINK